MGILKKLEERFVTGKVIRDYGVIYKDTSYRQGEVLYRVLLTEKKGEKRIIIKQTSSVYIAAAVTYHELDLNAGRKLKDILETITGPPP